MPKLSHILPLLVLAPLAACDLAPQYHLPGVVVPATYKEIGPWQSTRAMAEAPPGNWWHLFGDPTLDGLESRIDQSNPDLASAVARYDGARALAAESEGGLFPQIGLGGMVTTNKQSRDRPLRGSNLPDNYGADQVDATAGYEIDFWGKLRNEARASNALAQASAEQLATIHLSLESELASDYISLRGFDSKINLLNQTAAAYQQALNLTENLYQGKLVSSQDVSRAQTQLDTTQAQVDDLLSQRSVMEHAIATLVGQSASTFSIAPAEVTFALATVPTGIPSELLRRRPDIAAAERAVNAANSEIGVARAAFYPSLSLNLLGGLQSTTVNLFNLPDSFWAIGPDVSLPIFNGGILRAREAHAYANFHQATAEYRSTVLNAFQQVEDNAAKLRWFASEYKDESAAARAASNTVTVVTNLYQQGADSYLDVVTAQTALLQAQQSTLDIRTRQLLADVAMIQALGGGWTVDHLAQID